MSGTRQHKPSTQLQVTPRSAGTGIQQFKFIEIKRTPTFSDSLYKGRLSCLLDAGLLSCLATYLLLLDIYQLFGYGSVISFTQCFQNWRKIVVHFNLSNDYRNS